MCNTRKCFFLFIAFYLLADFGFAQNEINSPYSGFGIGNLSPRSNVVLGSMGGVGYALQNPYYINFKNPAAFAAFDSLSFIADLAFGIVNHQLKTETQKQSGTYAQLGYFAIGLPVLKVWRMSAGIMPFSDVGYGIIDSTTVEHFGTVTKRYMGSGGMQLLYWGNGFNVCKGLTLGMNLSYLFGTLNSSKITEYKTDNTFNTIITNFRYLDGIYISGGIQYQATIKGKHHLSIGAVYENGLKVWSKEKILILNYRGNYAPNLIFDTVPVDETQKSTVKLPQLVGGGIAYGYKDRLLASLDITWQNWKTFSMSNTKDSLANNLIAAVGVQYVPNPMSSKYFNKINFRIGTRISSGYLIMNNKPISEFAFSVGLGFPIRTFNSRSSINIMFEYSKLGTLQNNLILQNCFKFSFNFILQEKWYQRTKLE